MIDTRLLSTAFDHALPYPDYLATATPSQRDNWSRGHAAYSVTPSQRSLLHSFTRETRVLVISGIWCGDCAQECPALDHLARESSLIRLRFIDREAADGLGLRLTICGGRRVPIAIFLNEESEFVSLLGDRTLTRYRDLAGLLSGAACSLPGADLPLPVRAGVLQDWLNELERVQILLRLSPKLRAKHSD